MGVGEGRSHTREDRYPFSDTQLNKIFGSPLYTGCLNDDAGYAAPGPNRPKGTRFWIPLIGLFQGMRLNEICQLKRTDIERNQDVICIFDTATLAHRCRRGASTPSVTTDRVWSRLKNQSLFPWQRAFGYSGAVFRKCHGDVE